MTGNFDDFLKKARAEDVAPSLLRARHLSLVGSAAAKSLGTAPHPSAPTADSNSPASEPATGADAGPSADAGEGASAQATGQSAADTGAATAGAASAKTSLLASLKALAITKPVLIASSLAIGYSAATVTQRAQLESPVSQRDEQASNPVTVIPETSEPPPPETENVPPTIVPPPQRTTRPTSQPEETPPPSAEAQTIPPAAPISSIAEQARMIRAAESALRSNRFDAALSLLSQHETQFPDSVLREERAALRVIALCRAQDPSADAAFLRFASNFAGSAMLSRVRAACGR